MRDPSALLELLLQRDPKGIEELRLHYGPLIRYVIKPILPDQEDRDECFADVVFQVWERIERYDPARAAFSTWLTVLTRNAAINRARSRRPPDDSLSEGQPSPEPGPEELAVRRELLEDLRDALNALPYKEKILFYRKYYYMQSTAQIAAELGLTERAVEGRLYRLKKRLRKELGALGGAL